jgi:hypothetical protein
MEVQITVPVAHGQPKVIPGRLLNYGRARKPDPILNHRKFSSASVINDIFVVASEDFKSGEGIHFISKVPCWQLPIMDST